MRFPDFCENCHELWGLERLAFVQISGHRFRTNDHLFRRSGQNGGFPPRERKRVPVGNL